MSGFEFEINGTWTQVPADVDAVISWGWCGAILSNDTVKAGKHLVFRTAPVPDRRTTAVVFPAPDLDSVLTPTNAAGREDVGWRKDI